MSKGVILCCLLLFFCNVSFSQKIQEMKRTKNCKKISETEAQRLVIEHHGKVNQQNSSEAQVVYELDDDSAVIKFCFDKPLYYLYFDKKDLIKTHEESYPPSPLEGQQLKLNELDASKTSLIRELAEEIGIEVDVKNHTKTHLDTISKKIKAYGYKRAYENLYLHLVVFVGEQIMSRIGGEWHFERGFFSLNKQAYLDDFLTPFVIDGKGEKHSFFLKMLTDGLSEDDGLDLNTIIWVEVNANKLGTFEIRE